MLAVPKVHILYKGRDQDEHLRLMGYQQVEQPGDAKDRQGRAGLGDHGRLYKPHAGLHDVLRRPEPERAAGEPCQPHACLAVRCKVRTETLPANQLTAHPMWRDA